MKSPYTLSGETCLSFSGGKTSAYMLRRVLDNNTAEDLKRWLVVCFANTGKEEEETLRFVRECGERWGVPIVWLEYRNEAPGFVVVDFDSAAREGEPFEALIRKRNYLPNPVTRFCSIELKIRIMHKWLRSRGWSSEETPIDMMIGIRADEQRRVSKIRARGTTSESRHAWMVMPLADTHVIVQDVNSFWVAQPFNLELTTHNGRTLAGNCDLCFLKPPRQRASLIAERPSRATWWIKMEALALSMPSGAQFCKDGPSYAAMAKTAETQGDMYGYEDETIACFCGD